MGKAFITYDPMTMRWLNESSPNNDNNYSSSIFATGYEDPTYMTFRIEFGGWGASVTDPNVFNSINAAASSTNAVAYSYNYDNFPAGLLDLNFLDETLLMTSPHEAFGDQAGYNAYNWLMMRNEDTRAQYIKAFAQGLNELLREYPYIFLEISGIDSLEQFDAKRGRRLVGAQIKLKVLEGLGQKMRSLLEMYKKGAWDATYQRWVLPENYRMFKMIIYIFERRVFHSVAPSTAIVGSSNSTAMTSTGSSIVNFLLSAITGSSSNSSGQISGQASSLHAHNINASLPVMAYECDLCEINLDGTSIGDAFQANWNDSNQLETHLTINVGNVRTFYKNGLLQGPLGNMMIADLVSKAERTDPSYIEHSSIFSRDSIYWNDLGNYTRPGFGGGGDASGSAGSNSTKQAWDNMVNSWKNLFDKGTNNDNNSPNTTNDMKNGISPEDYLTKVKQSMNAEAYDLDSPGRWDNWWHYATVSGDLLASGGGSFWKKLWKVITAGTQQIRLSPGYPNAMSSVFYNILDYLWIDDQWEGSFYSYATRADYMDAALRRRFTSLINDYDVKYKYHSTSTYDDTLSDEESNKKGRDMKEMDDTAGQEYQQIENLESLQDDYNDNYKNFYDQVHTTIGDENMSMEQLENTEKPEFLIEPDEEMNKTEEDNNEPDIMENDYEYPDYVYPNGQMETVDFVEHATVNKIPDDIDYVTSGITRDDIAFELDKESGSIIVEKENGLYASLVPLEGGVNDPLIQDENGMVVIEKGVVEDILTNGVSTPTLEFNQIDEVFYTTENMINGMLQESELLRNMETTDKLEHIGNIDNMMEIAAEIAAENNTLKEQYAAHIASLLDALQLETLEVLNALPELEMVGYDDEKDADKVFAAAPIEAIQQLLDNKTLYSVERPELSHMSMQSLIAIEKGAEEAMLNTSAMMVAITDDNKNNKES